MTFSIRSLLSRKITISGPERSFASQEPETIAPLAEMFNNASGLSITTGDELYKSICRPISKSRQTRHLCFLSKMPKGDLLGNLLKASGPIAQSKRRWSEATFNSEINKSAHGPSQRLIQSPVDRSVSPRFHAIP